jgi:hypothetical protein
MNGRQATRTHQYTHPPCSEADQVELRKRQCVWLLALCMSCAQQFNIHLKYDSLIFSPFKFKTTFLTKTFSRRYVSSSEFTVKHPLLDTTLTSSCTQYTKFMEAKITLKIHIKSHIKTTPTCFGTQRNHPQGASICA